ncbi:neural-cadherin [Caerostris darwini]|uniref:Neural-cadherin n=1 Tax=Caerostris darwini TaxID=1538125 RepID=A0AAV4Q7G8_9ARAC|nr:neural-cadherin [Caerostris darwini]
MEMHVTKYIRIGIGDKNDNPPYFDQALYEAEVNEDEDIQHTVITVTAKDKDECEYCFYFAFFLFEKQSTNIPVERVTNKDEVPPYLRSPLSRRKSPSPCIDTNTSIYQ